MDLSWGPVLMSNPESFNLVAAISATDWLTSLPTNLQTFATPSSSSSDKAWASLIICTSYRLVSALQVKPNSLVNQARKFSRVSEFGAIILDEVTGCCIKWALFLCHSSWRVKWVGWTEKIRPWARGLCVMWVKTIGHGRGGHPCGPNPYSSWLSSIKSLKLVKLLQVRKKVILVSASSMQAWHRGTRSTQSPPARRASFQWCACPKVSFIYSTLSAKT